MRVRADRHLVNHASWTISYHSLNIRAEIVKAYLIERSYSTSGNAFRSRGYSNVPWGT